MEQPTLTLKIVKDEGFTNQLAREALSPALKDLIKLLTRIAVDEYIKETQTKPQEDLSERILRLEEVKRFTGLSRSSIYAMMAEKRFPNSVKVGIRAVGWQKAAIEKWMSSKVINYAGS